VNEQERVARSIEAHAAQKLTISEAADLLEREGRDLQDGLEVAGTRNPDDGIPADMESIDPGWEGFVERQIDEAAAPWEVAADATAEATYQRGSAGSPSWLFPSLGE